MNNKIQIDWITQTTDENIGNVYGYRTHNDILRKYTEKIAEITPTAGNALMITVPEYYDKKIPDKVSAPLRLTGMQKTFVEILHSMKKPNRVKAYLLAGYKGKHNRGTHNNAQKTLHKPHVLAYYESLRTQATKNAQKTADEIIEELEGIGFEKLSKKLSAMAKIKALELLGRRFGLFPNRQEHTGEGGGPIPLTIVQYDKVKLTKNDT